MLFIFDWDGTLCDSTGKIVHCMHMAADKLGLPRLLDHQVMNIIGLGLPEAIAQLYPQASPSVVAAVKVAYSESFLASDAIPMPLFDGVEETLNHLRDNGYRLTIATGKSRKGLDSVLASLGMKGFFHGSRCADETLSKPDPLMLTEILSDFQCAPVEAVMVGDTEYDMDMARKISMPRVAVSYGAHHIDRLRIYEPRKCLDRFSEILEILPGA
jgi:phosphoglycolate phosphatase